MNSKDEKTPTGPDTGPGWSRSAGTPAAVVGVAAAVSVCATFLSFPGPAQGEWLLQRVIDLSAGWLFILAAALLLREQPQRMTAALLAVAGGCWLFGLISVSVCGPFIGALVQPMFWFFAAWALLRYPDREVAGRGERVVLAVAGVWLSVGHGLLAVFYDPSWDQWPPTVWWPTLVADLDLYVRLSIVVAAVDGVIAVGFLIAMLARLRRLGGVDRWVLAPMIAAVLGAALTVVLRAVTPRIETWQQTIFLLTSVAVLAVPAALLAAIVRRRLTHTAVADIVVQLSGPQPASGVTAHLQTALRDPTLQVLFWVDQTDCYVDEAGRSVSAPGDGRLVIPLDDASGGGPEGTDQPDHPASRLGVVVTDPALARHPDLVTAAVAASSLALRNAQLQAELRAQLDQVRASRRRIAEAGVAERRQIERDLHDGLQQRLLALTLTLGQVRAGTDDPAVLRVVELVRIEVRTALQELRDVAHGVLPAMLAQGGLQPALDDVVERLPLAIDLDVAPGRWPPAVETTAYFIVCEGLANIIKHAATDRAAVRITAAGEQLRLEVVDNGLGGADPRRGTGLAGLADRARAIGGELTVQANPGGGTVLTAVLPCG